MAGIGFRLQKLLSSESYSDLIKAYGFSAIISSGPMLVVIILLTLLHETGAMMMNPDELSFFMGSVVYVYCFSMVGSGPILYIVMRYLADHYFRNNFQVFSPAYLSSLEVVWLLQSIPALLFLYPLLAFSFYEKWMLYTLYLFVNGIWLAMTFLSAAKSYLWIVFAFFMGGLVGAVSGYFFGMQRGFGGVLTGFTLGHGVIFGMLTIRIFMEFGIAKARNFDFLLYIKKYPYLFGVGLLFNVGIWIDKFVMWGSSLRKAVGEVIYFAPDYDTPIFLAFLCVVPSMAFFLIQMETSFARCYISYFKSIQERLPWQVILKRKVDIQEVITRNFQKFVVFQGIITGLIILLIYEIAEVLNLNPFQLGVFRIGLLGTFLQMGYIMFLNIFFYFDFQKEAFFLTLTYCVCNGLFTLVTLFIGHEAYGFGFTLAAFISLLLSFLLLDYRLKSLDYYTFMRQPIIVPKFSLEADWK